MQPLLYLTIGILIGASFAYLIVKALLQKMYVAKSIFSEVEKQVLALQMDHANKMSKEEVNTHYVIKGLYEDLRTQLENVEKRMAIEEANNKELQLSLLHVTKDAAQKLSKEEIAQDYVALKSFELLLQKLKATEAALNIQTENSNKSNTELTALQQKENFLNEKLALFKDELNLLHTRSQEQFKNIATAVLEEKKTLFVAENKRELNNLLQPFSTNLAAFKEKVEATRKEEIQDMTSLKKEIESLQKLNTQLSDDAQNLASALKSDVKMQGNWGEDRLNMILEMEGLQQYIDYNKEAVYLDEAQERKRRPDFILNLPEGKCIIIDSKVSLTAYVQYFNTAKPEEKTLFLKQHLKSVVEHINSLAEKSYQNLSGLKAPDYVFLFMPVEAALTLALNEQPEIFDQAIKKKIVLITPATLVASLKIVKLLWQKENRINNVNEIFRQCGELYNKFVLFLEEMDKIESALTIASKAHSDAMHHLKTGTKKGNTIIGRFETIKRLEAKTTKDIPKKHLAEIELLADDEPLGNTENPIVLLQEDNRDTEEDMQYKS